MTLLNPPPKVPYSVPAGAARVLYNRGTLTESTSRGLISKNYNNVCGSRSRHIARRSAHARTHARMHACTHAACTRTYACIHTHAYKHTCARARALACTQACTRMHTHAHTHTHTHTHTRTNACACMHAHAHYAYTRSYARTNAHGHTIHAGLRVSTKSAAQALADCFFKKRSLLSVPKNSY